MTQRRVALTGRAEALSRAEFRSQVEAAGWVYAASVDDDVDLLVVGAEPLESKVTRARAVGVEVVALDAFLASLGASAAPIAEVPLAAPEAEGIAALEAFDEGLRVVDVVVPWPEVDDPSRVPDPGAFAHYTLDRPTLELLRVLARAVCLGQPCLLEGDTASSKTSAIAYLAARLGQPLVRLSLNGQTDASELVGRYVPDGAGWRFHEGPVPQAMRHGWWLVLDEVNLAEPAALERLNPVLERHPSLLLSEGEGARLGAGGAPVHPGFRVFATMNPAEYQGRTVLSPAWRDRFVATWQATGPDEAELRQLLDRLVHGRQPRVTVAGVTVVGAADDSAPYAALAEVPGTDAFLGRLAALHAGAAAMARAVDGRAAALGASRRERYVFSRRGLLGLLDALAVLRLHEPSTGRTEGFAEAPARIALDALERTYLDPLRGEEDRARMLGLLRSLGLARDHWVDPFEEA